MAAACTRHEHNGPQDYRPGGGCIHCSREGQARYRKRRREEHRRMKETLDRLGLSLADIDPADYP